MRTFADRIRHMVLFEGIALFLLVAGATLFSEFDVKMFGAFGLMMSLLAMLWNLIYNWLFDLWDRRVRNFAPRTPLLRVAHAILFEVGLLIAGTLLAVWWLEISLWHAFVLDVGLSIFFVIYAYIFNWTYDTVFPPPHARA
ncbi:PACE efflux transporter [Shimia haliotis]|uniref:Uncharacterized membrane protein n=1 Tax=Shimia haliotis TaxID=1280847 RepID=A0A1I3ZX84_9RHOB|nr:PACE efflux transporter [Shimia haliotis]SFK48673.1 Uncharacterized membrane protein [Shimia haliotis]